MSTLDEHRLEQEIVALGTSIFEELESYQRSRLDPQFYTDKLMEYAMRDEELKVSLFRFVDVLPALESAGSVIRHVHEYFEPVKDRIPGFLQKGFKVSPDSLTSVMVARAIKQQVRFIADRFIVGENADKALPALRKIRKQGLAFTVDLVGEAALSEKESRDYLDRYVQLLQKLGKAVPKWPERAALVPDHKTECTAIHISVKLSALYSQARPISTKHTIIRFQEQLSEILSAAKSVGAYVFVDMEDTSLVTPTIEAVKQTLSHPVFRDYGRCGIVLQAYLRRTEQDVEELLPWIRKRGTPIGIRLVKGAYWDTETILARQRDWPIPVWQSKSCSDAVYERLSKRLLQETPLVVPAFASHNIRSLVHACSTAKLLSVPNTDFELQSLYGMAPEIKKAFSKRGYLVREYSPVGALIPGMGYLVRRLLENTSNEGFLRRSTFDKASVDALLKAPTFDPEDTGRAHLDTPDREFRNEPLVDFTEEQQRTAVCSAIEQLKSQGVEDALPILAGEEVPCKEFLRTALPEDSSHYIGKIHLASAELTKEAISGLRSYFPTWRETPSSTRIAVVRKAASNMRKAKAELTALVVLETGKPIVDADADVAEAIDFCEYYASEAEKLFTPTKLPSPPGEINSYWYEPRGVSVVIGPWNFPAAIPCGMFAASLVCGNCVLLKPAEQSSLIASAIFSLFLEAGMPPQAAAFLPGRGEEIGPILGTHPDVDTICFTGSKDVGLRLIEDGAQAKTFGRHVRKVVAEMGGKNSIIVDEDADLDEAVRGVVYSAFGFAGQKCSACSRVIVVGSAYERFCERLKEAVVSLEVGAASDPRSFLGPVIDAEAQSRLLKVIEEAKRECEILAAHTLPGLDTQQGYYVPPTVFRNVPEGHFLLHKELFGPVLAVEFANSVDEAITRALEPEYALTGAIFSRSPKSIQTALTKFRVGNLYLNRNSTGALVARQPFGGAAMSGIGSKTGGPDYLRQFVIPRAAAENSIRRGFAPFEQ